MICVDVQGPLEALIPPIRRWPGPAETATISPMHKKPPAGSASLDGNEVCARIRREREARNWTQDHLAQLVGVTEQTISRYERDRPPRIAMLGKIAAAMGLSAQDLMPEERIKDAGLAELVAWWRSASRVERRFLLQSARNLQDAREDDDNEEPAALRRG